jgi:cyanophycin synthetase
MIEGNGRIPIEVFVGGEAAFQAARMRQIDFLASGTKAWVTSSSKTEAPPKASVEQILLGQEVHGEDFFMATTGLANRAKALLMSRDVEAVILVLHDDDITDTLALIDRVDKVTYIDNELKSSNLDDPKPLSADRIVALSKKLANWST